MGLLDMRGGVDRVTYVQKTWQNDKAGGTQITADELNRMEAGIVAATNDGGANDAAAVHKTGDETISGVKKFTGSFIVKSDPVYDVRAQASYDPIAADNQPALQAVFTSITALSSSGVAAAKVVLPRGVVNIAAPVNLLRSAALVEGHGRGDGGSGSTLKWTGSAGQPMFDLQDCANARFSDMVLLGDTANPPSAAFYWEAPTIPVIGRNERCSLERVNIGRPYTTASSVNGGVQRGMWNQNVTSGNNDQYSLRDVNIHDFSVAGIDVENPQAIWANLDNVLLDTGPVGVIIGADFTGRNLTFNRCGNDLKLLRKLTANIYGYFSEHSGLLFSTTSSASLHVVGGKALLMADIVGPYWADIHGFADGAELSLTNLKVYDTVAGGWPLHIAGSNGVGLSPGNVYIRGCDLPSGTSDAGYDITGGSDGVYVDIEQGSYKFHSFITGSLPSTARNDVVASSLTGPGIGTVISYSVPASGDAAVNQAVLGSDSRLRADIDGGSAFENGTVDGGNSGSSSTATVDGGGSTVTPSTTIDGGRVS